MSSHANAKLTPKGRLTLVIRVLDGHAVSSVAAAFGVSRSTVRKWVRRYHQRGEAGLIDGSSRPKVLRESVPAEKADRIEALRREGHTYAEISRLLAVPPSTVALVCKRRTVAKGARADGRRSEALTAALRRQPD